MRGVVSQGAHRSTDPPLIHRKVYPCIQLLCVLYVAPILPPPLYLYLCSRLYFNGAARCSMDAERDTALNCGHTLCYDCASKVHECPSCREDITLRVKLF